tara:strand:+ start:1716 stop:2075 length:360 start_codon:yes stop_codon:yes gene_type:complete
MPINIDAEDFLKIIKDTTFQRIITSIILIVCSFYAGRISIGDCTQDTICSDIINDKKTLSKQISDERIICQDEKMNALEELHFKLNKECALRVEKSLESCDFDENIHCPICVARGVCRD